MRLPKSKQQQLGAAVDFEIGAPPSSDPQELAFQTRAYDDAFQFFARRTR